MPTASRRIAIRTLADGDRDQLAAVDGGNGWNSAPALWSRYAADLRAGRRLVVIAWDAARPLGYGTLMWVSDYDHFRTENIPEINNLGVDNAVRRQGVATALIHHLEQSARQAGRGKIGLGVGLYADYGPAQRLYFRLGYQPDGRGITYAGRTVAPAQTVRVDDDLILWMSKPL